MKTAAASLLLLTLLAGCGGAPHFFQMEIEDHVALREMTEYGARPAEVDFTRPGDWELKNDEWAEMLDHGNQAWIKTLGDEGDPPIYRIGADGHPDKGGIIELKVSRIQRGHYSYFTWGPAIIDGTVTITDAKTGVVIFKGTGQGITPDRGGFKSWDLAGDDGRIRGAYFDIARDLYTTLNYYRHSEAKHLHTTANSR